MVQLTAPSRVMNPLPPRAEGGGVPENPGSTVLLQKLYRSRATEWAQHGQTMCNAKLGRVPGVPREARLSVPVG